MTPRVLWHYYLIAGPEGDQLIATFTLGLAQQAQFADQDLTLDRVAGVEVGARPVQSVVGPPRLERGESPSLPESRPRSSHEPRTPRP